MRLLYSILVSTRLMGAVLLLFAISIAVATFVESSYGSDTARALVYNAKWFEFLLAIGLINLLAIIFYKKLYKKEKLSIFLFHLSFLLILIGAAITRYFGFEGYIHIREGESGSKVISERLYLMVKVDDGKDYDYKEKQLYVSSISDNYQKFNFSVSEKKIRVECLQIIPNAVEVVRNDASGKPVLVVVFANESGRQTIHLREHQSVDINNIKFSFNDAENTTGVNISTSGDSLKIATGMSAMAIDMNTQKQDAIEPFKTEELGLLKIYSIGNVQFVVSNYYKNGKIDVGISGNDQPTNNHGLRIKMTSGDTSITEAFLSNRMMSNGVQLKIGDVSAIVNFGSKEVSMPFSIKLKKFILEHYPGSKSPSWFESRIVLQDPSKKVDQEHRIYMNNVLNYRGYRFYQTSYDEDEKGTILSVNKDFWGTFVTYLGYFLLIAGIFISLLNKKSRFRKLSASIGKSAVESKFVLIPLVFAAFSYTAAAQEKIPVIEKKQAELFGQLLIQDQGGRIKPINTLSSEFLRKVYRKTEFADQNADQVLLGMMVFPEYWQNTPIIKISNEKLKDILNIDRKHAAFNEFIKDSANERYYVLEKYVNDAYRKKPALRSKFDTEVIRTDERVNLCYLVFSGQFLKIFPNPDDSLQNWNTPLNAGTGLNSKDSSMMASIIPTYFQILRSGQASEQYNISFQLIDALQKFQYKKGGDIVPSVSKVKTEIWYNRLNIFERIDSIYGILGFILLIIQFVVVFRPNTQTKIVTLTIFYLIIVCFVIHILGLAMRWYISGHAPWSNAYESMLYIAFATVLAGIVFSKKSYFTLALSSILAWLILYVAHLNWMDPEIGHLVPVLKSYWLLIHVAVITGSYGFFAMGALMAFVNLVMMGVQTKQNRIRTDASIGDLTTITEMSLIIGLYMLTIGTFLGGIWANESWGRYWAWDPKETWALVSILVYAFVAHMRMIPGLKSTFIFNLMALLAFSSIIMTYFGVNYYLSGLHSYAKGDPVPVPTFVYYTISTIAIVATLAWFNLKRIRKEV